MKNAIYWLLFVLAFLWAIGGQPVIAYGLIRGWDNMWNEYHPQWYIFPIMILSWFTIPIYGVTLISIKGWMFGWTEEDFEIDRIERSYNTLNPDIESYWKDLEDAHEKYHPKGKGVTS